MKNLIKIKSYIWLIVFTLIGSTILVGYKVLNLKIEKYFKTKIFVDKTKNNIIYFSSQFYYLLRNKSKILIRINQKNYLGTIDEIYLADLTEKKDQLFEAKIEIKNLLLLPKTTLNISVIYAQETIIQYLKSKT